MPGLLDIAPSTRTVSVGDKKIPIPGISARGIASILERFPEVRAMFAKREINLEPSALFELVPRAVSAIIVAGIGFPGDEAQEKAADALPLEAQADLLEAIVGVTMPKGLGPFVDRVLRLTNGLDGKFTNTPDTKSPRPSKPS